jgi:4-hydroxythreonine-4-phosphate dehydrogenase
VTTQEAVSTSHADRSYRPLIGIAMGDPGGIGAELIVRALADPDLRHEGRFIIYGLEEVVTYAADRAEILPFWFRRPHESIDRVESGVVVADFDEFTIFPTPIHQPTRQGGEASMRFLEEAIGRAKSGPLDVLITGPVSIESWKLAGIKFRTLSDKLADAFGTRRIRRMLVGGPLKVVLASDHEPLFSLWQKFGIGTVFQPLDLLNECLRTCFGISNPRIAVCSLNPQVHSDRHFGDEEPRVIEPAILMAREAGIRVEGPLPAADVFACRNGRLCDGVVAMYYDQGAVAVRMVAPDATVAATLGLPTIHLQPEVGPSFDKAGREPISEGPMRATLLLALEMARNRMMAEQAVGSAKPEIEGKPHV